jgi:hypothetical protein
MTADGKGVPLVPTDALRLRCFEERPARPGNRRMATLASVYSVDRHVRAPEDIVAALFRDEREEPERGPARPEPCHKRVIARFPGCSKNSMSSRFRVDHRVELGGRPSRAASPERTAAGCLMDGQTSLWMRPETCLADELERGPVLDILDIVHVASYVWRAAVSTPPGTSGSLRPRPAAANSPETSRA